jgi:hypothetical protein
MASYLMDWKIKEFGCAIITIYLIFSKYLVFFGISTFLSLSFDFYEIPVNPMPGFFLFDSLVPGRLL